MNYSHFVGLDVGKKTFDASLMSADEKELSHKSFDNTPTGIQSLLDWIAGYHPVSYTHLDVYKRQMLSSVFVCVPEFPIIRMRLIKIKQIFV